MFRLVGPMKGRIDTLDALTDVFHAPPLAGLRGRGTGWHGGFIGASDRVVIGASGHSGNLRYACRNLRLSQLLRRRRKSVVRPVVRCRLKVARERLVLSIVDTLPVAFGASVLPRLGLNGEDVITQPLIGRFVSGGIFSK
jgi:hypothetical protein